VKRLLELFNGGVSVTEPLRDKLIRCGWVTNFNADTLVRLIERHYASLDARAVLARWDRPAAKPVNDRAKPTKTDLTNLMHDFVLGGESAEDFSFDHIGYAHAVLARWGQQ
jgi:hypothetical protein